MPAAARVIDLTNLAAAEGFIIQGDGARDNAGRSVSNAGDVNGDGIDDVIVGAHLGDNGGTDAGEAYVIFGKAGATLTNIDLTTFAASDGFIIQGERGDYSGFSVSNAGDVNGDGIDDIIVGTPHGEDGGGNAGEAYVIFGKAGATRATIDLTSLSTSDGFVIQGDAAYDQAGFSVSAAGDVNGDGIDDVIVGAPYSDNGGYGIGNVYVIFGQNGATRVNIDLTALSSSDGFIIQGGVPFDYAGRSVSAAGDVNGDGFDDLIVGVPFDDNGSVNAGQAYVIFGKMGATRANIDLDSLAGSDGFVIMGDAAGDLAGYSVSNAGDVNGDGIDDIIVGASHGNHGGGNVGEAYVIFGKTGATRATIDLTVLAASDGFVIHDTAGNYAGHSVSAAGDVNGDGVDDLIVGAFFANNGGGLIAGEAHVIFGKVGTTRIDINLSALAASDGFTIQGDAAGDRAGFSVSTAGDINGDGFDDLIVGAPANDNGGYDAGTAYVIYGSATIGGITGTNIGETLTGTAGNDIIIGLGGNDVLIGGGGSDALDGGTGNDIYVVDSAGDTVSEAVGEGIDGVETDLSSYTLPANVETLEYTGAGMFTGTGNDLGNTIVGGGMADTLSGGLGNDLLAGEGGNDMLVGGDGSDVLIGGTGADMMDGGDGNDRIVVDNAGDVATGGAGIDTLQITTVGLLYTVGADIEIVSNLSGGDVNVTLNALANTYGGSNAGELVNAGDGQDSVYGRGGDDRLRGDGGNDYLFGEAGDDILTGGDGADFLYGGANTDLLIGDAGNDTLYGEAGADTLFGGTGIDVLHGGAGGDIFQFSDGDTGATIATADRITDFAQGQGDVIDLGQIDAIRGDSNAVFAFIGTGAFSNVEGQLRYAVSGGNTFVQGDTDGDGVADFIIRVDGLHVLNAGDFVL